MAKGTYFTQDELGDLVKPTARRAIGALEAGDYETVKELLREFEEVEKESLFFIYVFEEWVAILLSYIGQRYGTEELYQALRSVADIHFKPLYEEERKLDFKSLVKAWAGMMRAHSGRGFVRVTEDEKKVTFELDPCGSGGRMILAGAYRPPKNLFKVKGPLPLTHGFEEAWPVYCSHCAVLHLIAPIDWGGAPFPVVDAAKDPTKEPCHIHFYKDPKDVPEEYYTRVGKKKRPHYVADLNI